MSNLYLVVKCDCGNEEDVEITNTQASAIETIAIVQGWYEAENKWWCSFDCWLEDLNVSSDRSEALTIGERNPGLAGRP